MKENKNKKREEAQTPVPDGDTRPDQNQEPDLSIGTVAAKREKKITKERGADINNLEDFRDAK
jgi:hypothetical protein